MEETYEPIGSISPIGPGHVDVTTPRDRATVPGARGERYRQRTGVPDTPIHCRHARADLVYGL